MNITEELEQTRWAFDAVISNQFLVVQLQRNSQEVTKPYCCAGSTKAPAAGASAASIPAGTVPGPGLPQPSRFFSRAFAYDVASSLASSLFCANGVRV